MQYGVKGDMSLADQERNNLNRGRSRPTNQRPLQNDRSGELGADERGNERDARPSSDTSEHGRVQRSD